MARLNPLLLRLSRWPRRLAALACLLLAAAAALAPPTKPARAAPIRSATLAAGLGHDEVAVPVTVASARAASFVHVGDRVGVLADIDARAGPMLVADGLRVLATAGESDELAGDDPVLLVAADRATAARLAGNASAPVLVVLDRSP